MDKKTADREKFINAGASTVTDEELLSMICGNSNIAATLMEETAGSLRKVVTMSASELCAIKGIGRVKASEIAAAFEIYRRAQNEVNTRPFIHCAEDVFTSMVADIGMLSHEELWVV